MNCYFFDVVGHERSELDYTGRMLPTAEGAYDAAEMMAFDLAVKRADEMVGFEVAVSKADGRRVFSIPVKRILSNGDARRAGRKSDDGKSCARSSCSR